MYIRITRNIGMRVGVFGAILLFPIAVFYWSIWLTIMSLVWAVKIVMWFMLLPAKVSDAFPENEAAKRTRCMAQHPSNHKK